MNEILKEILKLLPVIIIIIAWAIRLEVKIATIGNDISWIKKALNEWQQSSEDPTP